MIVDQLTCIIIVICILIVLLLLSQAKGVARNESLSDREWVLLMLSVIQRQTFYHFLGATIHSHYHVLLIEHISVSHGRDTIDIHDHLVVLTLLNSKRATPVFFTAFVDLLPHLQVDYLLRVLNVVGWSIHFELLPG